MATPRGATEAYLDVSPLQAWDQDKWDEYDASIDIGFHAMDIHYTPLMKYVGMPQGADYFYTGTEMLSTHTNHNAIGLRQRFIDAMYIDFRRKRLQSNQRYGGKVQLHEFDELVSRWGNGTPQFMMNVLRRHMMSNITHTHEKLARDALFQWAVFAFLANGTKWEVGTADWSTLTASSTYQVDIKFIEDVKLRLAERSKEYVQEWGTYAQPVPGRQFARDLLVLTTPNIIYDIWNTPEGQWMEDLYTLQDQRIINGGVFRYKGVTFAENRWGVLYNAGPITWQCGVTSAINWGDGAPDPDVSTVENVYYTGQSGSDQVHYVQCDSIGTSQFVKGDRVTIHTARTATYGVTTGCDVFDGESYEAVVYEVDEDNERLVFTQPVTQDYISSFEAAPASTSTATIYAFITKARHIHPIVVIGSRGMHTFASRTKIRIHNPQDNVVDLPGVVRVSWDEYGEFNRWNPYIYEVIYAVASDTRSGYDQVSLR